MPSKFSNGQTKIKMSNASNSKSSNLSTAQTLNHSKVSRASSSSSSPPQPTALTNSVSFAEEKTQKYNKLIFVVSFLTSLFLLFSGLLFLFISSISTDLLYGLISTLIGGVQMIIDIGWVWLIKINRLDIIKTWKDAFDHVAKVRGSKIFIFPMIFDILIVAISAFFLLKI